MIKNAIEIVKASYQNFDTNKFGYSFVSKHSRMSHSVTHLLCFASFFDCFLKGHQFSDKCLKSAIPGQPGCWVKLNR